MKDLGDLIAIAGSPPRASYSAFEVFALTTAYHVLFNVMMAVLCTVFLIVVHRYARFIQKLWRFVKELQRPGTS